MAIAAVVVGHDFGSTVASVTQRHDNGCHSGEPGSGTCAAHAPRKHYQTYYQREMRTTTDCAANTHFPLASNSAAELAKLPRYDVMDLDKGMAESVVLAMPTPAQIAACRWLTDEELRVYSTEYGRTGLQGGLQSYRVSRTPRLAAETQLSAGRPIDVPSLFLSGKADWGVYQRAGGLDGMKRSCTTFEGVELVEGAGHWVQQEKATNVAARLRTFVALAKG
jgi:pimeloyl-ACP methyl ester carboxylesterase